MVNWGVFSRKPKKGNGTAIASLEGKVAGEPTNGIHDYNIPPTDGATALKPEDHTSTPQPLGSVLPFATQEGQATPRQGGGGGYSGGGTTTVRGGFHFPHIPKWAAYTLTALALLTGGAAAYETIPAARNFVDTQYQRLLNRPQVIHVTPASWLTPTPTIPTIPVDKLAVIRQYQPGLASVIEQQEWFKDGLDTREQATLSELEKSISVDTGYLSDKLTLNGAEKDIAILYDKGLESRAQEAATYLKAVLPKIQEFFGLPVRWYILFVRINQPGGISGGGAGGGTASIDIYTNLESSGFELTIKHEGTHLVVDQDDRGPLPIWYNESLAEIGRYVSSDGGVEKAMQNIEINKQHWRITKPLSEYTLEDHTGGATAETLNRGIYLLLSYRALAGHDAFKQFVGDADLLKRTGRLTNETIRQKMLLHTPEQFKSEVTTMYDAQVYGK